MTTEVFENNFKKPSKRSVNVHRFSLEFRIKRLMLLIKAALEGLPLRRPNDGIRFFNFFVFDNTPNTEIYEPKWWHKENIQCCHPIRC